MYTLSDLTSRLGEFVLPHSVPTELFALVDALSSYYLFMANDRPTSTYVGLGAFGLRLILTYAGQRLNRAEQQRYHEAYSRNFRKEM